MGISYGGHIFATPRPLYPSLIPKQSGVYAIQTDDAQWRPQPYRPIYFGETGDFSERGFPYGHHAYFRWCAESGPLGALFISFLYLPFAAQEERQAIEAALIRQYSPVCNRSRARLIRVLWNAFA